jgi:hypothetical protein
MAGINIAIVYKSMYMLSPLALAVPIAAVTAMLDVHFDIYPGPLNR